MSDGELRAEAEKLAEYQRWQKLAWERELESDVERERRAR